MGIDVGKVTGAVCKNAEKVMKNVQKSKTAVEIPSKRISDLDKFSFRQYLQLKSFDFKTTPEELNKLFQFEGDEFLVNAYDFFCTKLTIPKNLRPTIYNVPAHPSIDMTYNFLGNYITRNPNAPQKTKSAVFGAIRHELQHFIQNLNILRTEELGDSAINFYSKSVAAERILNINNEVRNLSLEQLQNVYGEEQIQLYKNLKNLLKSDESLYKKELENLENLIAKDQLQSWQNYRSQIISEMGIIKKGSQPAKRAEKMFDEFSKKSYYTEDGQLKAAQYYLDLREFDALAAQNAAVIKLLPQDKKYCGVRMFKDQNVQAVETFKKLADEKALSELSEAAEDLKFNPKNIDQMISYYFD